MLSFVIGMVIVAVGVVGIVLYLVHTLPDLDRDYDDFYGDDK